MLTPLSAQAVVGTNQWLVDLSFSGARSYSWNPSLLAGYNCILNNFWDAQKCVSQCLPSSLAAQHLLGALVRALSASRVEGARVSWAQGGGTRAGGSEAWGGGEHPSFHPVLCHTNLEGGAGPGSRDQGPCLKKLRAPVLRVWGTEPCQAGPGRAEVPMGMSSFELSSLRVQ